ncbi:CRISPR-associated protein, Cas6 family [Desulforamulus putei DSM 12395]|uniref:CRISPR-associated endoribonuclease n=1 Tax=Desulforamulus putei DSM 12395 TaxID=1121429 RepID=A0A1M5AGX1_9FIRM|nr:CRISPR-associated endoribonuclease Cas6 [Desulforamulus putei]SHF29519.1 CRISPR-associated protein, Cas6 family [Desulforamulus putei DSM 12395]
MRLKLSFYSHKPIIVPTNYHQQIQGLIYRLMTNEAMQKFLHDRGFNYGKRTFKMFCFSRLLGRSSYDKNTRQIIFKSPVYLFISSPWIEFLQNLLFGLMTQKSILLGSNPLEITEVKMENPPDFDESQTYNIKMLSPVTIYSTLINKEGGKKTYYYSPTEREFESLIRQNLVKKAQAFYNEDWSQLSFSIKLLGCLEPGQQKIIIYKGSVIKGWMSRFVLQGHPRMLKLAYGAGLGGKNSQGLGMFCLDNKITGGEKSDFRS